MLRNSTREYGFITKLMHWLLAILIILQFYLVYQREFLTNTDSLKITLILLHKAIGIGIGLLAIAFLCWHFLNKKPKLPKNNLLIINILAITVHYFLFLLVLAMAFSGYFMSAASAKAVKWFAFTWPTLIEKNLILAGQLKSIHIIISYILIGMFILHVTGALTHHFIYKDNILKRMLPTFRK